MGSILTEILKKGLSAWFFRAGKNQTASVELADDGELSIKHNEVDVLISREGSTTIPNLSVSGLTIDELTITDLSVDTLDVGSAATIGEELILNSNSTPTGTPGTLYYDSVHRTVSAITGVPDVSVQIGQEMHYVVINNTGVLITNGTPVHADGVDGTQEVIEIAPANADNPFTALSTLGLTTADIDDGEIGIVTSFGIVRDMDTSLLSAGGAVYLDSSAGGLTNTKPLSPNTVVLLGTVLEVDNLVGKVHVSRNIFSRPLANKSYSFTSNGIGAGTYYAAGFYDAPDADTTLTDISLTQTHGSANNAYAAHAFIVAGAAGTVDTGVVGLRVTGDSITDEGVLTGSDTEIIVADITTLATDIYLETPKKWLGTCTFELYEVSGSPTTYSLDFNYGYAKYEDFGNKDFSVNTIEAVGLAGANDTSFDMHLLKHDDTGWTYAATGFVPGNGVIVDWSGDMSPYDNLVNGKQFAWKRADLATFIEGSGDEGIIVQIITGANNSVQSMDVHIVGEVESF